MAEEYDYQAYYGDVNTKVRDIEEKYRILKDRTLLIGQNLVETKGKTSQEILEIKKDLEILKQTIERIRTFLESFSAEISKFARKEDLEILTKQAKMFQPLEFVRKSDLENRKK